MTSHKDNTGGCRPPGGEPLGHTEISWSHGRGQKRAIGEGGIMKRVRGEGRRWVKMSNESGNEENVYTRTKYKQLSCEC